MESQISKRPVYDFKMFGFKRFFIFIKTKSKQKQKNICIILLYTVFVHPWVLNFPPWLGPGGSIPTGNVASLVSSNCPLWEERRGNTTRLPWVATRKPEEGILEVESYWEFVLS